MIIGFTGKKGVGKSTAADFLVDSGWEKLSFANPLRRMLMVFLKDFNLCYDDIKYFMANKEVVIPNLGVSFRHLAQTLGTDWGRCMVRQDIWVQMQRFNLSSARFGKCANVVYDDIRFEDEAALIRSFGGKVVHVLRPGLDNADGHASESGIAVAKNDVVLDNCGNHGLLLDAVLTLVSSDV